jgi:hypothetical protein
MEELEWYLEQLAATLSQEQTERIGPALGEFRQAVAALGLADAIREDARETAKRALRAYEQVLDDHERADADFRRAWELLTGEEE